MQEKYESRGRLLTMNFKIYLVWKDVLLKNWEWNQIKIQKLTLKSIMGKVRTSLSFTFTEYPSYIIRMVTLKTVTHFCFYSQGLLANHIMLSKLDLILSLPFNHWRSLFIISVLIGVKTLDNLLWFKFH